MREAIERTPDQEALATTFGTFFAREATTDRVRAAEPLGFDAALWESARSLGVPEMAIGGATLADLAVVAEVAGRHLAPIPLVGSLVALRLLERLGDQHLAPELVSGQTILTLALRPVVKGIAELVPNGAIAAAVIALDGDDLVLATAPPPGAAPANIGAAPLANRRVEGATVLAHGDVARTAYEIALDEWRVLTAAALVGLARRALDLAIAYASAREQFGVPIGSFQALQHRLADVATSVDGAILLARLAAAEDRHRDVVAPMALWFGARAARRAAGVSLHVHGGYGFMLEQDIQLFFRRATAWPLALGDPAHELERVAAGLAPLQWSLDDDEPSAFRLEVRKLLAEHCPPEVAERASESGTNHDWHLHRALAAGGWLAAEWPLEDGGQGRDAWEMLEFNEELARAGAPIDGWGTSNLVAHTLALVGTPEQRADVVPRVLAGEILCCLGYSEPDSGSDVASAATRAVRDGDDWVINGQKMFTTLAQEAAYVFLLTRTNTTVAKHRGLTMFLVPMSTPGIELQPIHTLGGERTNVTFYTDARVPDSCRVGEIDGGWDVMTVALAFERNPTMVGELDRLLRQVVEGAAAIDGFFDRPAVRVRMARAVTDLVVGRLLGIRMTAAIARGELPIAEGSMAKLFSSEALVRAAASLLDAFGAVGVLSPGAAGAPAGGWVEHAHRHAQVTTIQAGTSEIQRTIIAERGLGLPRSPRS
jgi:alkylation response protein AidB-like acyl-CoA dehydrogenase